MQLKLLTRLSLAVVFGYSGWTKLRDRRTTENYLAESGASDRTARSVARVLPLIELSVGCGYLLRSRFMKLASAVSVALLSIFTAFLWKNMVTGKSLHCACFGQHLQSITGWRAIARNGLLVAANAYLLRPALFWEFCRRFQRLKGALSRGEAATLVAIFGGLLALAFEGWRRADTLSGTARIQPRSASLPTNGARLPTDVRLTTLDGHSVWTASVVAAAAADFVLVFVHPGCKPCMEMLEMLSEADVPFASNQDVYFIARTAQTDELAQLKPTVTSRVLIEKNGELSRAIGVTGTPTAVAVDRVHGSIKNSSIGKDEILKIISR